MNQIRGFGEPEEQTRGVALSRVPKNRERSDTHPTANICNVANVNQTDAKRRRRIQSNCDPAALVLQREVMRKQWKGRSPAAAVSGAF